MTKIKPCPFCKSTYTEITSFVAGWSYYNSITYVVRCIDCGCYGPKIESVSDEASDEDKSKRKEDAIKIWNKRYSLTK
jgi:hypothetical protein